MKAERREGLAAVAFGIIWTAVAVVLFCYQVHYRVDDHIDQLLGTGLVGLLGSVLKIALSLFWIFFYFGGPFTVCAGFWHFLTGGRRKGDILL